MEKKSQGFTLIELMITVAVLAIVAAVAIPSYTNFVLRAKRAEAKAAANIVVQQLERCYSQFGSYNNAGCAAVAAVVNSDQFNYTVAAGPVTPTTYVVTATPVAANPDPQCGALTISQTGTVEILGANPIIPLTNPLAAIQACWDR